MDIERKEAASVGNYSQSAETEGICIKAASVGKYSQSAQTEGICILVVNNDVTCNTVVAEMLRRCSYEVLCIGSFLDVFNAIWENKDRLDHVVTNVHNLESNGAVIAHRIEEILNVHVLLMNYGGEKIKSDRKKFSFAAYILTGLSITVVDRLWQYALMKKKAAGNSGHEEQNDRGASMPSIGAVRKTITFSSGDSGPECPNQTNKRHRQGEEDSKGDPSSVAKKPRVVWTAEMHQKFLEAIEIIGCEKAVPKKIVEVMGIPGLTRENVASHLQKFRNSLKRTQETALSSVSSSSTAKEYEGLLVLPSCPDLRLNSSLPGHATSLLQGTYAFTTNTQSISMLQSQYLKMHSKPAAAGGGYPSSVDRFQQRHIPGQHFSRNSNMCGDIARNMLLTISNNCLTGDCNWSNRCTFVGYRLTGDGNSIEFGEPEASENSKIAREEQTFAPANCGNQSSGYWQNSLVSSASTINIYPQPFQLGVPSCKTLSLCQTVDPNEIPTSTVSNSSQEQLFMFPSRSATLLSTKDLSMAVFESTHGDVLTSAQNPKAILGTISQQPCSPCPHIHPQLDAFSDRGTDGDKKLLRGTQSTGAQFDVEEFDDKFFMPEED